MRIYILFLSAILAFNLSSCAFRTAGWQSNNPPGKYKASFKYFKGKETNSIKVLKGDVLLVSYNIQITQGQLILSVANNGNQLWQKQFSGLSDTAEFQLPAMETGVYKIVIKGEKATGSFDINYKAAAPKKIR